MFVEYIWIVFDKKYSTVFEDEYLWLGAFTNRTVAYQRAMDHAGCFSLSEYNDPNLENIEKTLESKQILVRKIPVV